MPTQQEFIAVGFQGKNRASEVLGQLQQLNYEWTIDLADAVAVYRTDDGKLRVDQSVEPTTKEGAAMGGLVGIMLGGLLAAPFTGGLSAAAAAAAVGAGALGAGTIGAAAGASDAASFKEMYGISDEFVQQVGGMVQPGESAVFALLRTANPETVIAQFKGYGGRILRTSLNPVDAAVVQRELRA
jgi:uncharacterized membrane protein